MSQMYNNDSNMCFLIYTSIKCDGGDGMVHYILVLMWIMEFWGYCKLVYLTPENKSKYHLDTTE